ncbi:MAG: hypothetical protein L3J39_14495 [Verrucomicrobiales bacterium]|nr:hypothetical protein [Verrucomicrobiales bacterium]
MDDYEKWEQDCERIRGENEKLLLEFAEWQKSKGLSAKTVSRHVGNVSFYIDEFLLYEDAIEAKDGLSEVGTFLGYWFIKKAMWSSVPALKSTAGSLKKFYQFMADTGEISATDLAELKQSIKEGLPEWIATMSRYDDPEIDSMEEVWGL